MRYLGGWVGGRSGTDLSESGGGTSFPNFGFGGRKNMSKRSTISDHAGGASFQERRLSRRSADEVGRTTRSMGGGRGQVQNFGGSVQAAPSKRTITNPGYGQHRALASAEELTTARRASSWGDVAGGLGSVVVGEHDYAYTHGTGHDFGYAASPFGGFPNGQGEGEEVDDEDYEEGEYDAGSVTGYGRYGGYGYDYGYGNYGYYQGGPDVDGYASGDAAGEALDDEVRLVGAGGVLTHSGPISGPSSPNSLSGVSVVVPPVVVGSVSVVNQGAGGVGPTQIICSPPPSATTAMSGHGSTLGVGVGAAAAAAAGLGNRPRARSFGQGYAYGGHHSHHHHHPHQGQPTTTSASASSHSHYQQHQHHLSSPLARTPLNLDGELAREFSFEMSTGVPSSMDLESSGMGMGMGTGTGTGDEMVYGSGFQRIVDDDADAPGAGSGSESGGVRAGAGVSVGVSGEPGVGSDPGSGGESNPGGLDGHGRRGRGRGLYDTRSAEDEGEEGERSHHNVGGRSEGEEGEEEEGPPSSGESECSSSSVESPIVVRRRRPSEALVRSMSRTRPGARVEVEV